MRPSLAVQAFLGLYIFIFFLYLFGPLVIMSVTAFSFRYICAFDDAIV